MICIDSSIAVKWLSVEPDSSLAVALLRTTIAGRERMVVPHLLFSEVTNVLWQKVRRGDLDVSRASDRLEYLFTLPLDVVTGFSMYREALALSRRYSLPAAYDAQYLAVAQQWGAIFWTADRRLLNALGGELAFVRPLHSYAIEGNSPGGGESHV